MDLVILTVEKIAELFIILLVGVLIYRLKIIDDDSNRHITDLLMRVVIPCALFMSYQMEFDTESLKGLGITAALSALSLIISIVIADLIIPSKSNKEVDVERMSIVFSNCVFIGVPIVGALAGEEGVFYLSAYITVFNLFFWTYGYSVMSGVTDIKAALKNLLHPTIIAIVLGLICFIMRIHVPAFILSPIEAIGSLNTPLAMIVAGCNLAASNIVEALKRLKTYYVSFVKLILLPAIMVVIFRFIPVPLIYRETVILTIACPSGSVVTMLALRFGKDSSYASLIFSLTTLISMITIPLIVFFMSMVM